MVGKMQRCLLNIPQYNGNVTGRTVGVWRRNEQQDGFMKEGDSDMGFTRIPNGLSLPLRPERQIV